MKEKTLLLNLRSQQQYLFSKNFICSTFFSSIDNKYTLIEDAAAPKMTAQTLTVQAFKSS